MTGARLRSTRSAWPCPGQGLAHSPQKRAAPVTVARADDRPLIQSPSGEHSEQAERARQHGLSPVRAVTSVTGSAASKARPEGGCPVPNEQRSQAITTQPGTPAKSHSFQPGFLETRNCQLWHRTALQSRGQVHRSRIDTAPLFGAVRCNEEKHSIRNGL